MSDVYVVNSDGLNLRTRAEVSPRTRLAILPRGHEVTRLGEADVTGWWKVHTAIQRCELEGVVHSAYLVRRDAAPAPKQVTGIAAVHLQENRGDVTRAATALRAYPLGEGSRPQRTRQSREDAVAGLGRIIDWLDVERSARYKPTGKRTFCNIYAYDYCYLAGVYLPRVWWNAQALHELRSERAVSVLYDQTVHELNANELYEWLGEWGDEFGWRRCFSADDLQSAANAGGIGIICAQRRDREKSGHVATVVPETATQRAQRQGGAVRWPLQSQAGSRNYRYRTLTHPWWSADQFRAFGFWVNP